MKFTWSNIGVKKQDPFAWDLKSYKDGVLVDFSKFDKPEPIELYNENGEKINNSESEYPEQCLANAYVRSDSVVLELGARYGSVSCIINKKLSNKLNQVSVEPDSTVWDALESNIDRNGCTVNIYKGFISKKTRDLLPYGYAATSVIAEQSTIPSASVENIEELCGLKFDTLVSDCEGFLEEFFDEHPQLYTQLTTVIFEADYPQKCNYDRIRKNLKASGFREIISGFQNVYTK